VFEIGQQVACVNDDWVPSHNFAIPPGLPYKGGVYTIYGFRGDDDWDDRLFLKLEEYKLCYSFLAEHFKPVRKTSIEVFNKALLARPMPPPKPLMRERRKSLT
jgi:hypothetical protein